MAARCGEDAKSCIVAHWSRVLPGLRKEPAGWRAPCPLCGRARRLSVQVKASRPMWNVHCGCDPADVGAKLAALLPQCIPSRSRPHRPDPAQLVALAEDRSIRELALRVALLELAGISLPDACDRLGVSRAQRYRVVSQVRQRRRS